MKSAKTQTTDETISAGEFSAWLGRFQASLRNGRPNEVDCGDCVGCCSSSYFVHLVPEDREARRRIPPDTCVPAPGLPEGNLLMGCKADGRCPLLDEGNRCTIYAHRPRTCRTYDCRIFAAAGIAAGGRDKATINRRVRNWVFTYSTDDARRRHEAIQVAAKFIAANARHFPGGRIPTDPSQLALLAVRVHDLFLEAGGAGLPKSDLARAIVERSRQIP